MNSHCYFGLLVFVCYCIVVAATGTGHNHGHGHGGHGGGAPLREDPAHVAEHMEGKFDKPVENMTQEELTFHYFKFHDYDNNNKLDGLELIKAVTHYDAEQADAAAKNGQGQQQPHPSTKYNDEYFSTLIDGILKEGDSNNDGYIDYAEFVRMQHRTQ